MADTVSFPVVDQAINTLKKVNEYINAGMDTTIDVAQDLVENDKGQWYRPKWLESRSDVKRNTWL